MNLTAQIKATGNCFKRGEKRPKQKRRMRPMSKKRERDNREYLKKRKVFLKANPKCMICVKGFDLWPDKATEVHHGAGRTGSNFLDESTWFSTCRTCHSWVHNHPSEARSAGFLAY